MEWFVTMEPAITQPIIDFSTTFKHKSKNVLNVCHTSGFIVFTYLTTIYL